ncbi:MAG: cobyric acid synthase, partial [Vicinamibacterales bacterium]
SNAGKSWMATAICAWLRKQGVRVAPFKAQNMSNHSYPCRDGGEIGRAQVAQAEACGLDPEPAMNPILLKPNGNGTSQVIVHGRVWKTLAPRDYYAHFDELLAHVLAAYEDLARRFDVIVIEGAGSVSELNLRPFDLVNLGLVTRIGAPWVLVADIERGGVFASVLGTVALLTPEERVLFRGFLVNKFRGDQSLFDEGRRMLESRTGSPCLGVFPYAEHLRVDAEDSLALDRRARSAPPEGASIAIVQLPRLSNGTDFRLLSWADWVSTPSDRTYDFVILPGTKDTIGDLNWLREHGLEAWVRDQHRRGAVVIGICGGFQMLGEAIHDPDGMESVRGTARGLGLLPVETVLSAEKTTRLRRAATAKGMSFSAYEIHLGVTTASCSLPAFAWLDDGTPEGVRTETVVGTYLHGALEDPGVCAELFGVQVDAGLGKEAEYIALAEWFERSADHPETWLG